MRHSCIDSGPAQQGAGQPWRAWVSAPATLALLALAAGCQFHAWVTATGLAKPRTRLNGVAMAAVPWFDSACAPACCFQPGCLTAMLRAL
jgi:hypothetical protein